jgi:transposase
MGRVLDPKRRWKKLVKGTERTAPVTPAATRARAGDPTANRRARRRSEEKLAGLWPPPQVTEPLLKMLDLVCRELEGVEAELTRLSAQGPVIQHLCTVPGVGLVVAAVFVSAVDDAKRFQRAHQLESRFDLVSGEHSSRR